ncbi:hypothetical protein EJ05DRAFT_501645 [Pseudovirgaria hyperparasitica]|uniref:C2H2-type domain-containing protein n=1 Tax=Pseudovirgaria hyperparasitica TaxID=470096 RepID=A0A6A6W5A4_9PEZI|nr:uncharacterized protein EJ05DRAFT_501645 [Pseudovirgaria hyperparasitica]KAF2757110.1 hypothetical protein EJ05DRAFT_501645 [Pseudovirgaria hyperparasitica]
MRWRRMLSDFILDLQEEERTSNTIIAPSNRSMHATSNLTSHPTAVDSTSLVYYDYLKNLIPSSESEVIIKKEKSHECPVCHKSFTRKAIYLDHYRSQHSDERILCSICSKPFKRQNDRRRHEKLHSDERAFRCQGENENAHLGCGKRFARLHSLREHQRRKPETSCYELISKIQSRRSSATTSIPSEPDSLSEDDGDVDEEDLVMQSIEPIEIIDSPTEYDMEYIEDTKPVTSTPPVPHISIQSAHISWPSVIEAKIRQQAGRALAATHHEQVQRNVDVKNSVPSPSNGSAYHCWLCPSRYTRKESFEFHLQHHFHELEQRPYHCSQCGGDFSLIGHLNTHMSNCTAAFGLFRCNYGCGRAFPSKEDMIQHCNAPDDTGCFEKVGRYEQHVKAIILNRLAQLKV